MWRQFNLSLGDDGRERRPREAGELSAVGGALAVDATPLEPWLLELRETDISAFESGGTWVVALANEIAGFDH